MAHDRYVKGLTGETFYDEDDPDGEMTCAICGGPIDLDGRCALTDGEPGSLVATYFYDVMNYAEGLRPSHPNVPKGIDVEQAKAIVKHVYTWLRTTGSHVVNEWEG